MKNFVLTGIEDPRYMSKERIRALEAEGARIDVGKDGFYRVMQERESGGDDGQELRGKEQLGRDRGIYRRADAGKAQAGKRAGGIGEMERVLVQRVGKKGERA